uniref:Uncharacterized protein n=1 Tax=viral metagenome TaxID=1070528 RepID=A0A6M3K4I7_9ZZZZ
MSMADIRERITAILAAIEGVGNVHEYQRFSADLGKFRDLFKWQDAEGNESIRGWIITRKATAKRELTSSQVQKVHVFDIRGYMGMQDSGATEIVFQDLLNSMEAAIDADYTLSGACETTTPEWGPGAGLAGLQIQDVDLRMFGGVLCHFAQCRLGVQEEPVDV